MPQREWTASTAVLQEGLRALAINMQEQAQQLEHVSSEGAIGEAANFLRDHAYTLSEWADAVEQLYARLDVGEGLVTNAQGTAIARLMRGRLDETVTVSRTVAATAGLPADWLYVTFTGGFECGIAPDGSVSS